MSPIPKMVIATALARRKGELEASTEQEIDELISELIIAKTGLRGAASAIGAQGAADAAREVEADRQAQAAPADPVPDSTPIEEWPEPGPERALLCGALSPWETDCALAAHPQVVKHADAQGREWEEPPPQRRCQVPSAHGLERAWCIIPEHHAASGPLGEPAPAGCPECGVSGGEHEDDCKWGARWASVGERVKATSAPAPVVEGAVIPMRRDEAVPVTLRPCPVIHPADGRLCSRLLEHQMPHRDLDGREWVTSRPAVGS